MNESFTEKFRAYANGRMIDEHSDIVYSKWIKEFTIDSDVMIPMSDGVKLAADIYKPKGITVPLPVILYRTLYNKDRRYDEIFNLIKEGVILVAQDIRGFFHSEGCPTLFESDTWRLEPGKHDGYDTIEWILKQKWCNGEILTVGTSGPGYLSLFAASVGSKAIKAQHVRFGTQSMYDGFVYYNGVYRKEDVDTIIQRNFPVETGKEINQCHKSHPLYDAYWSQFDCKNLISLQVSAGWDTPSVSEAGWYDLYLEQMIELFETRNKNRTQKESMHRMVIGPWIHGHRMGEIPFPNSTPSDVPDGLGSEAEFLKAVIHKRMDKFLSSSHLVYYYMMGDYTREPSTGNGNVWMYSDVWPVPSKPCTYFLIPGEGKHDGVLSNCKGSTKDSITYAYDPANPVPTIGGANVTFSAGACDQNPVLFREDVLVFTTAYVQEPLRIAGDIKAVLYVSSDAPDTDFTVKLMDVYPDGRSILICDTIIRGRLRNGFYSYTEAFERGNIYRLNISVPPTAWTFAQGHRLRVAISSSNYPRFMVNYNSVCTMPKCEKISKANNTVYFSKSHPSHLVLPIIN